jgi:hypothetical protein
LWRRRADARAFMRRRQVPVDERIPFFGELLFWLFLVLAAGSAILALARPQPSPRWCAPPASIW